MTHRLVHLACASALLCAAGAGAAIAQESAETASEPTAVAMKGADGADLGTVTITQTPNGLVFSADFKGMPDGAHGFHVHETGTCEGNFDSAGGHYNPTDKDHGYMAENGPHAGDLPNFTVADGAAAFDAFSAVLSMTDGAAPLNDADGSSILVHAEADDYMTAPSGHSGGRIACGVIFPAS